MKKDKSSDKKTEKKETSKKEIAKDSKAETKENLKYIFIGVGLLIIIIIAVIKVVDDNINRRNYENLVNNHKQAEESYAKVDGSGLYISCELNDPQASERISYIPYNVYGVGDYLYCSLSIYKYNVSKMSFNVNKNDNIDFIEAYSKNKQWQVTKEDNSISLLSLKNGAEVDDVILKFYIKNKISKDEDKTIKLNSIRFTTSGGSNYLDNGKTYKITFSDNRRYLTNGVIIFEKVQNDGSFKKVNEYKCKTPDSCYPDIAWEGFSYVNADANTIMLEDKENDNHFLVLFNFDKGIVDTYGAKVSWLYSAKYDYRSGTYLYIKSKDSDKYGIIDANGNMIHEFNLGATNAFYKSQLLPTAYSIENDMIIDQKDNKYGVSKIKSNDIVIDYEFESIRFIVDTKTIEIQDGNNKKYSYEKTVNNKYFKAQLDGKWYLYSFDMKDKVIDEGYDNLFVANDEVIVAEKDKYLYIKDYEGNNLVEDKIEDLSEKYNEYICCAMNPGIEVETKDNIVTIKTYKDNVWENYNQYEYNISSKTLLKVK